ncbi:hypothetical protein [Afifella pfennigii]|nr:hypothetical protein [Afifella pfennigii]
MSGRLEGFGARLRRNTYRPEKHYMRGAGPKSNGGDTPPPEQDASS